MRLPAHRPNTSRLVALPLLLLCGAGDFVGAGDAAVDSGNTSHGLVHSSGSSIHESRRRLHFEEACVGGHPCDATEIFGCVSDDGCAADRAKCEAAGAMCAYSGPAPEGGGGSVTPPPPPASVSGCEKLCGNARKASTGNCLQCTAKAPVGTCADADTFCAGEVLAPAPPPAEHNLPSPCDAFDRVKYCGDHGRCVLSHTGEPTCECENPPNGSREAGYSGVQCDIRTPVPGTGTASGLPCCDECGVFCSNYPKDAPCFPVGATVDPMSCIAYCAGGTFHTDGDGNMLARCAVGTGTQSECLCAKPSNPQAAGACYLDKKYCAAAAPAGGAP